MEKIMKLPKIHFDEKRKQYYFKINYAETKLRNIGTLKLYEDTHPCFLRLEIKQMETSAYVFFLDKDFCNWKQYTSQLTLGHKINACIKTEKLLECFGGFQLPVIHPENLYFLNDGEIKIGYRGLYQLVSPYVDEQENYMLSRKALVISTIYPTYSFDEIYSGSLLIRELPELAQELYQAVTNKEMTEILLNYYEQVTEETGLSVVEKFIFYGGYILFALVMLLGVIIF